MTQSRRLLQHFLAALAYRTQKALRGAPSEFASFRAAPNVRTPHELLWHMTGLIGYARTMFRGGEYAPEWLPGFSDEVARFHESLALLRADLVDPALQAAISDEQFLQGPLADAMTHAGQLAMLRRLAGRKPGGQGRRRDRHQLVAQQRQLEHALLLEGLAGSMLAAAGVPLFLLATFDSLRNYQLTNSLVWFCSSAAAGLAAAASVFWFVLLLSPHLAVLAMVLALLVQLSAFVFVALYIAKKRVLEQRPI